MKELCEKDGGVTVYEQVRVTRDEFKRIGVAYGTVPLPPENGAPASAPYVTRRVREILNPASPFVSRSETFAIRRSDGKVLARSIQYLRRGGDFPTGLAEGSHFVCPKDVQLSSQIFILE